MLVRPLLVNTYKIGFGFIVVFFEVFKNLVFLTYCLMSCGDVHFTVYILRKHPFEEVAA